MIIQQTKHQMVQGVHFSIKTECGLQNELRTAVLSNRGSQGFFLVETGPQWLIGGKELWALTLSLTLIGFTMRIKIQLFYARKTHTWKYNS